MYPPPRHSLHDSPLLRCAAAVLMLSLLGLAAGPALAQDFDCADPADIPPGETDVAIIWEASADEAAPGDEVTYTIRVHNCGPETATNVDVEVIPQRNVIILSFDQISGPTFSIGGIPVGQIIDSADDVFGSLAIASMAAGETAVFEYVVRFLIL